MPPTAITTAIVRYSVRLIHSLSLTVAGQLHDAAAGDRLRVTLDPIVFVGRESPRKHVHVPLEWPEAADLKIVNLQSSCGCLSAEAADGRAIDFAVHLSTTAGLVDKDVHVYAELSNGTVIVLEQSIVSAPPILTLRSLDSPHPARDAGTIFVDDLQKLDVRIPLVLLPDVQIDIDRIESDPPTVSAELVPHAESLPLADLSSALRSLEPEFHDLKVQGSLNRDQHVSFNIYDSNQSATQIGCQVKDARRLVPYPRSLVVSIGRGSETFRVLRADGGHSRSIHSK